MAATYWQRVTIQGEAQNPVDADSTPLDLQLVGSVLACYAADFVGAQTAAEHQGLTAAQSVEFGALVATMPVAAAERPGWVQRVLGAMGGARLPFSELDTIDKLKAVLGVAV